VGNTPCRLRGAAQPYGTFGEGNCMFRGNRLYLFGVVAMIVALLIASLMLELNTQARIKDIGFLNTAQARKSDVAEYLRLLVDAETSQRGFLLTQDPRYLEPYEEARLNSPIVLERISNSYLFDQDAPASDVTRERLRQLRELGNAKMEELAASITLNTTNRHEAALELVRTNYGRRTMQSLRAVAAQFDEAEDRRIAEAVEHWQSGTFVSRAMLAGGTLLNLALLILVALLLDRDLKRREAVTDAAVRHTQELEEIVQRRTTELSALSSHLQRVAEREKAAMARELHDELGGIMVAAKMDVSWLEKRLATNDADLKQRWLRLRKLLEDGLNLKRRVVETLRPTLLDNMGLVPAVQWVYQETCGRAGLKCTQSYPDQELALNDEAAIAVFRVIQEAMTNIIKHAKATEVDLAVALVGDRLQIRVRDNGIGIAPRKNTWGSQGLASMQHRVTSFGGTAKISALPGGGTSIEVSLPWARISAHGSDQPTHV
jgi:signal transduction histidine kinase